MPHLDEQIINALASGVIALDRNGSIIRANPAACLFLGVPPGALLPGAKLEHLPHTQALATILRQIADSDEPVSRHEITLTLPDGSVKQIGLAASVHRGQSGFEGVVVLFTDLTERLRMQRSAELNRQLAALGELTAGVVHELRNPVSVISGLAELLVRKLGPGDERTEAAQTILHEAMALERSIAQFLGFARPFELQFGRCTAQEIVERTLQLCRRRAEHKDVHVESSIDPDLPEFRADPMKLAQALSNVVNNAIDAVSKGGRASIRAFRDGKTVVFEVSDNGPGVQLGPGEDLFAPFFTKKEGGTGLGLTIAHRIVSAHDGTMSYGNRPDGGACFLIMLPATPSR
jgi:two-component system sensor histidine kinase AtoS